MLEYAQNIRQNYKLYDSSHEKLESGVDSRKKNCKSSKNPEKYLPGKCPEAIVICNINDAIQFLTEEEYQGNIFTESPENINHFMYMVEIKKLAKTGHSDTNDRNKQPG